MNINIQLTTAPIPEKLSHPRPEGAGAWTEFCGVVRGEESGAEISALEYEAYPGMAEREIRRLLEALSTRHPCLAVNVIHRTGAIPVGETAIYVGVAAKHRGPAFALLAEFMDRLKKDVPIWKRGAVPTQLNAPANPANTPKPSGRKPAPPLADALAQIRSRCAPLPGVRIPLAEAHGRVLRETVPATEDFPSHDRSTRDGYAILHDDPHDEFTVVDIVFAADWKPRQLQPGEAVRVATGASLPAEHLRVVMQEDVQRDGDKIKIIRRDTETNVRTRGSELRAGDVVLPAGRRLAAGPLALLASAGCTQPLVSPQLRVIHFTTGDEIIPPDRTPKPGQVRDSNSILIRSLLKNFGCEVSQHHLPEDFVRAKTACEPLRPEIDSANVILVSGGASVGDSDFTAPFLEWLGFAPVFSQVNIRPGRPLIFAANGPRIAFGLPGNPLSHFVCFHVFVAAALAGLEGAEPPAFVRGVLADKLDEPPNPRETLWPARMRLQNCICELQPVQWNSSGDVTAFREANALIRIPPRSNPLPAGAEAEFLPAGI
jgi:molybdopterin molybdotransferase